MIIKYFYIQIIKNFQVLCYYLYYLRAANEEYTHAILETAKNYFEGKGVVRSLEKGFYWCSLIQETNENAASLSSCWAMVRELAQYLEPEYRPILE